MAQLTPGARGSWEVKDLRGVDFSSSPMEVSPRRATQAVNFLNEAGITQKRNGWEQRCMIAKDGVPQRINGIFEFVDGEHREVLVHAGRRLYRIKERQANGVYPVVDVTETGTYAPAAVDVERLTDTRSQAFLQGGKMYWIGAGDFLVYGSWDGGESYELRRVYDNEDTYIPKTTINIGYSGNDARSALDAVNYMTGWRRNGLTGLSTEVSAISLTARYYLDAAADAGAVIEIRTLGSPSYTYRNDPTSGTPDMLQMVLPSGSLSGNYGSVNYESGEIVIHQKQLGQTPIEPNYCYDMPGMEEAGGDDVAEVYFYHKEEGYSDRIAFCRFGVLFGTSGNTDRLFLAGNPDFPNVDFYSAMDDYTYFEDVNTVSMG
jgi:hypothetical protein